MGRAPRPLGGVLSPAPPDLPPLPPPPKRGRWARRLGAGLALLVLGPVVIALMALTILLGTDAGNRYLLGRLLPLVQPPAGEIAVGALHTDLLGRIRLDDVSIRDAAGRELYGAASVEVDARLGALVGRRLVVDRALIEGLRVALVDEQTCLDPASPWDDGSPASPSSPWTGLGFDLDVRSVAVVASAVRFCAGSPMLVAPVTLTGSVSFHGPRVGVQAQARGLVADPAWGPLALDVAGSWTGPEAVVEELKLALGPNRATVHGAVQELLGDGAYALTVDSLAVYPEHFGAPEVRGPLTLTGSLTGPLLVPALTGAIGTPGGPAAVTASVDLGAERPTWSAVLDTPGLAVHAVVPAVPETVVAGRYAATGAGFGWPDDLDAEITVDGAAPVAGGYPGPFRVTGAATLHGGVVDVHQLTASTRGIRASVDGMVGVVAGDAHLVARAVQLDLARLADFGAPGLAGQATFTGRVNADWQEAFRLDADGVVTAVELDLYGAARVGAVAGPVVVTVGEEIALRGTLDATNLVSGDPADPTARLDSARVVADVTRSAAGALDGTVVVGSSGLDAAGHRFDGVNLSATLAGQSVGFELVARQGPVPAVVAQGRVALDPLVVDLDEAHVRLGTVSVDTDGPLHLALVDGGVADLSAALRIGDGEGGLAGEGTVRAAGSASLHGPLALTLDVERVRFAALAILAPGLLDDWEGEADLHLELAGTGDEPQVAARAAVRGLTIPDAVVGLDAAVTARREDDLVWLDLDVAGVGGALLAATGTVPLQLGAIGRGLDEDGPLDLDILVPPADEARLRAALPALASLDRELRYSAEAHLTGSPRHPEVALTSTVQTPVEPGAPWLTFDLDGHTENGRLQLRTIVREKLVRRAEVTGSLRLDLARASAALRGGEAFPEVTSLVSDLALNVVPLQLPVEALAPNALAGVSGSLLGGLYVSGDELAPQVQGAVLLLGGKIGRVPVTSAQFTITPSEARGYSVDLSVDMGDEGGVRVHGVIPWMTGLDEDLLSAAERTGILLSIDGAGVSPTGGRRGLPLAALEGIVPGFEGASGLLELSGAIGGTFGRPDPRITLGLTDASFSLRDTGVRYRDLTLAGTVDRDAVRITRLSLDTESIVPDPGSLEINQRREGVPDVKAAATVGLDGWAPTTVRGTVALSRARLLSLPSRRIQASGDLVLGGTWPRVALRGDIGVDRGYVRLTESAFTQSDELSLDPEITIVRPGTTAVVAREADELPLPDLDLNLSLARRVDVDVTMPTEQLFGNLGAAFSNLRVQTTLDGDLDLNADDGALALAGNVEAVRGQATVLGKNFQLSAGSVSFTGRAWMDPILALTADYAAGTYGTITAEIGGTASAPTISLTGSDGLGPDDAVAVLLFGAPLGGGTADDTSKALAGLLLTSLSNEIQQAKEATALDVIELGLGGSTRVGKRLGRTVLVVIEVTPSPDDDESPVTVQIEVQLPKRWFMVAEYGSRGEAKVSALRKWRL